jgi:hypothetical protein
MPPLTGRESSILALIAQNPSMPRASRRRLLGELEGMPRQIALALFGSKSGKRATEAAAQFHLWASQVASRIEGRK